MYAIARGCYAPGGFDNVTKENFESRNVGPSVMGTRVHQIALFVVFESPSRETSRLI
jgi:alpha-glucosidase